MGLFGFFGKKSAAKKEDGKTILVVEDEPDIAEGIQALLTQDGFNVVLASNGEEGVEAAETESPILVVMDLTMPKLNGFEACKRIKQSPRTRDVPILVLTAMQLTSDVEKAFEAGASDYLTKPYDNDRLLAKVHKLLANGGEVPS